MKTCLLIDGTDNPVAIRAEDKDVRLPCITWGRAGQTSQQFKFDHSEGPEKEIMVYRLIGDSLTDEVFLESAVLEVDKILNPIKYRKMELDNEKRRRQAA